MVWFGGCVQMAKNRAQGDLPPRPTKRGLQSILSSSHTEGRQGRVCAL